MKRFSKGVNGLISVLKVIDNVSTQVHSIELLNPQVTAMKMWKEFGMKDHSINESTVTQICHLINTVKMKLTYMQNNTLFVARMKTSKVNLLKFANQQGEKAKKNRKVDIRHVLFTKNEDVRSLVEKKIRMDQ